MGNQNFPLEKTVLFIGHQRYLSVKRKTNSTVSIYIQKRLHSSKISNWLDTLELLRGLKKTGCLAAIFLDLDPNLVYLCTLDDYSTLWNEILLEMKQSNCFIFIDKNFYNSLVTGGYIHLRIAMDNIYQNNIAGLLSDYSFEKMNKHLREEVYPPIKKVVDEVIQSGITCTFYHGIGDQFEKTLNVLDAIDPQFQFRIYVPKGNYKEGLINNFLKLFEDYMQTVAKTPIMIDRINSEHGTMFIFKSNIRISQEKLENSIERFSYFLDMTQNDIKAARDLLNKAQIDPIDAEQIITKHIRDYNRIKLDIRHQFEERSLALRHRLENEVLDINDRTISTIESDLDNKIMLNPRDILSTANYNFFVQPVSENNIVQNYYGEVLNGDITYSIEDHKIIGLIDKYAIGIEAPLLKSEYDILKDKSIPKDKRQIAWEKIKGFLVKVTPIIGEKLLGFAIEFITRKYLP